MSCSLHARVYIRTEHHDKTAYAMVYVINHICKPRNMECKKNDHRSYEATKKKSGLQQEIEPTTFALEHRTGKKGRMVRKKNKNTRSRWSRLLSFVRTPSKLSDFRVYRKWPPQGSRAQSIMVGRDTSVERRLTPPLPLTGLPQDHPWHYAGLLEREAEQEAQVPGNRQEARSPHPIPGQAQRQSAHDATVRVSHVWEKFILIPQGLIALAKDMKCGGWGETRSQISAVQDDIPSLWEAVVNSLRYTWCLVRMRRRLAC